MKFGIRKPSLKKSFKARTTGKMKRAFRRSFDPTYGKKGVGFIKNPKKSIYNKVYHKTTFGINDLFKNSSNQKNSSYRKTKYASNKSSTSKFKNDNFIYNSDGSYLIFDKTHIKNGYDLNKVISLENINKIIIEDFIIYIYINGDLYFYGNLTKLNRDKVYKLYKSVNKANKVPYKSYFEVIKNLPKGSSLKNLKLYKFVLLPISLFLFLISILLDDTFFGFIGILFIFISIAGINMNTSSKQGGNYEK
ncbi:hypothetical protein [Peptoniphilus ovalis]|uniref:hypothetical protein n=1 Tax=Peptoniphilus ovalis TaxID=2841503 RepID=UPI0031BA4F90